MAWVILVRTLFVLAVTYAAFLTRPFSTLVIVNLLAGAEYQDAAARVDVWRALLTKAVAQGNLAEFVALLHGSGAQ